MTPQDILKLLEEKNVKIWADGDRLRYNAPRGAVTPEFRQMLLHHKEQLLAVLQSRAMDSSSEPSVSRASAPLSFSQERVWFMHQLAPEDTTDNIALVRRLTGPLNIAALEKSVNDLLYRHDVLRTVCDSSEARPGTRTAPYAPIDLPVTDLSSLPEQERNERLQRSMRAEVRRPFALTQPPLIRPRLFRLGRETFILLVVTHLFVCDGWSSAILVREVSDRYAARCRRPDEPPSKLLFRYTDFAAWQRNQISGSVLDKQRRYWRRKLSGARPIPMADPARNRTREALAAGRSHPFEIPSELAAAMDNLARENRATPFAALLAAFQLLLHRRTGLDDIITGTIISNRSRSEAESLVGTFANNILIRTVFSGEMTFRRLMDQVRRTVFEAFAHQDIPFEWVIGSLDRKLQASPLFRIMFLLHQSAEEDAGFQGAGIDVEKRYLETGHARYDVNLVLTRSGKGLSGVVEYNAVVLDADQVRGLVSDYREILARVCRDPDRDIDCFPTLRRIDLTGRSRHSANPVSPEKQTDVHAPPESDLEIAIARIWQDLLGVDRIGRQDTFFDLGGHSLLAMEACHRIRRNLKRRVPPNALLFQTLGQIAASLEADTKAPETAQAPSLPFFMPGRHGRLFGCFHPPASVGRDCGVVLCPPQGHEYMQFHRAYGRLAILLAQEGFPVLRFDYTGCGDSWGRCEEGRVSIWLDDISSAVAALREKANCRRVCLAGLRFGATMAWLHGEKHQTTDHLVLWDPVIRGKDYLEEVAASHGKMLFFSMIRDRPAPGRRSAEVRGFALSRELAGEIKEMDLLQVRRAPAASALVLATKPGSGTARLASRMKELGVRTDFHRQPNEEIWAWVKNFDKMNVPYRALRWIVEWMSAKENP